MAGPIEENRKEQGSLSHRCGGRGEQRIDPKIGPSRESTQSERRTENKQTTKPSGLSEVEDGAMFG